MKKSDLKTGMLVRLANGDMKKVMLGTPVGDRLVGKDECHCGLDRYNCDMTYPNTPSLNIMEVYSTKYSYELLNFKGYNLIWQRTEKTDVTIRVGETERTFEIQNPGNIVEDIFETLSAIFSKD